MVGTSSPFHAAMQYEHWLDHRQGIHTHTPPGTVDPASHGETARWSSTHHFAIDPTGKIRIGTVVMRIAKQDAERAFAHALDLHRAGNHSEAEMLYRAIRKSFPDHPDVTYNFALLLGQTGRTGEALPVLRRLVRLFPDFAAAFSAFGVFLKESGLLPEAITALEQADRLRPNHAPTLVNLGNSLAMAGRHQEAASSFTAALAADPMMMPARTALATLHLNAENGECAGRVLRSCLAIDPAEAEFWRQTGKALAMDYRRDEAGRAYDRAALLAPRSDAVRHDIRRNLMPTVPAGKAEAQAALAAYETCLNDLTAHYADASPEELAIAFDQMDSPETFLLAYGETDVTGLLARQGDLMSKVSAAGQARIAKPAPRAPARRNGRIRVAIVSEFFRRRHPVWKGLVAGWVHGLDRKRFEVIGVPAARDETDDAKIARSAFDRIVTAEPNIHGMTKVIVSTAADILIYPDGPIGQLSHRLSALRLAPVQCASWGHPITTGLPTLDVFLSADAMEPADAQAHYRERLVRIAHLGTSYSLETQGIVPHGREWLNEAPETALFACIHSLYKYLPDHDWLFPRIAQGAAPCRLIFFEDPSPVLTAVFQSRLAAAFSKHGMDWAEHCRFLPRTTPEEFYRILGAFDVYLDPPGFSGFNTAQEALSFDIPVVSAKGRFLRGRLASGILHQIGMDDLVTDNLEDYAALACSLARDSSRRADISSRIRAGKQRGWQDPEAILSLQDHLSALV
ncbi:glycosyltransferase family 41 protein [Azospirillum sp. TSH100]|uniref:O-linked N-acetylglucosamine transferase, SPINDLY family protein n=2 Tax=Azospirillum sp. TSH100 TaxID=652764 RepID=UPI00145B06BB|nr:glycosyltransferase family 41 protein [Azospirillum sp. TSH100]